jgi:hypothetical protein
MQEHMNNRLLSSTDIAAIEAKWIDTLPRTHWENCHLTSGHQSCAIAKLLMHIQELEKLK